MNIIARAAVFQLLLCLLAVAQSRWGVEVFLGDAYCFKSPLTIRQSGYENIRLNADYDNKSFKSPIYYAIRLYRGNTQHAWELELIHLKLILKNRPPEVAQFEVSHGYNMVAVNHAWVFKPATFRLGAGVVIAHPENVIRGKALPGNEGIFKGGYYLSGPLLHGGIGKKFRLFGELYVAVEGKLTVAYANVPVVDGDAGVPSIALHALLGAGYRF